MKYTNNPVSTQVKQYFLMFDMVSYLYLDDVTTPENSGSVTGGNGGTDVMSPSQYSILSQVLKTF